MPKQMQRSSSPPRPTVLPKPSLPPKPSAWKALQPPPTQTVLERPTDAMSDEKFAYLMQQIDLQKEQIDLLKEQNEYQAKQNEYQAKQIEGVTWDIAAIRKKFNMRED
jgi:hypothetical protein